MNRDMKLVFELIEYFERKSDGSAIDFKNIEIDGYDASQIGYHVRMLYQAGIIDGEPVRSTTSDRIVYVIPFELTWAGHEFLAASRDDKVHNKALTRFGRDLFDLPFEVISAFVMHELKRQAGIS